MPGIYASENSSSILHGAGQNRGVNVHFVIAGSKSDTRQCKDQILVTRSYGHSSTDTGCESDHTSGTMDTSAGMANEDLENRHVIHQACQRARQNGKHRNAHHG